MGPYDEKKPDPKEVESTPEQPSIDEDDYLHLKELHDTGTGSEEEEEDWQYWRSIVNPYD